MPYRCRKKLEDSLLKTKKGIECIMKNIYIRQYSIRFICKIPITNAFTAGEIISINDLLMK